MKAYKLDPDWASWITFFYKRDPRTRYSSGQINRGLLVPSSGNRRLIDHFTLITEAVKAEVRCSGPA